MFNKESDDFYEFQVVNEESITLANSNTNQKIQGYANN